MGLGTLGRASAQLGVPELLENGEGKLFIEHSKSTSCSAPPPACAVHHAASATNIGVDMPQVAIDGVTQPHGSLAVLHIATSPGVRSPCFSSIQLSAAYLG